MAIVQAALRREELERRLGLFPGGLGGRGLIPQGFCTTPQPVRLRRMAGVRLALTAVPVQRLLRRVGTFTCPRVAAP